MEKLIITRLIIVTVLVISVHSAICQSNQSTLQRPALKEEFVVNKKSFLISEKKEAKLSITNISDQEIKLPVWLYHGRDDDSFSEIVLEIFMLDPDGKLSSCDSKMILYNYLTVGREQQSIKLREKIEYDVDLEFLSNLNKKGFYRARAILRLKKLLNCPEIVSSWVDFEVK